MARQDPAAKRYAQAVLDLAREANAIDAWAPQLQALGDLFAEPTVMAYLGDSSVTEDAKFQIIDLSLQGAPAQVRNLAKLLVRKRRTALGVEVVASFSEMVNAERGVAVAAVTTAQPLDEAGRGSVVEAVRRVTGATDVQLSEQTDRTILGGAIIQIGDHIVDGSVRARLAGLRRNIAGSIR